VLQVGDPAPGWSGTRADGSAVRMEDLLGNRHAVLYFFPRDFTPGCTREACSFRDHREEIGELGGEIYGISLDPPQRHARFAERYHLPFPLISDGDGSIARAFGVLRLGGWLFTKRVSFVIDRNGTIRHVLHSELNTDAHIDEAIAALRTLA